MVGYEFPQLLLAALANRTTEFLVVSLRGNILGIRISPELHDMLRYDLGSIVFGNR
jgi:hypothetical protein